MVGTVTFLLAKQERLEHVRFGVEGLGDLEHGLLVSKVERALQGRER